MCIRDSTPGDDKLAVVEAGHRRVVLIARGVAVDRKRITQDLGIAIEALADDAVTGGVVRILRTVRFPGNNEAAIAQSGDRWVGLIIMRVGADQELTTQGFAAIGIKKFERAQITVPVPNTTLVPNFSASEPPNTCRTM